MRTRGRGSKNPKILRASYLEAPLWENGKIQNELSPDPECPSGSKAGKKPSAVFKAGIKNRNFKFFASAGKYYKLEFRASDYLAAQAQCNENGGTLVQPKNSAELEVLRRLAGKLHRIC